MFGDLDASNLTNVPGVDLNELTRFSVEFLLISLRLGAFFLSSPIFGARSIPTQVRIVATFAIAAAFYNSVPVPDIENLPFLSLIRVMGIELVIGLSAGLMLTILFASVSLAGEKVASSGGLGFAQQVDPSSGGNTPVVSNLFTLFLIHIFLSSNMHLKLLMGLRQSFDIIPMGQPISLYKIGEFGIGMAGEMFYFGALFMLPVVSGMLLVNATVGVVTRSAPSLNFFSFGFPLTMMAMFFMLYVYAKPFAHAMEDLSFYAPEMFERFLSELKDGRE